MKEVNRNLAGVTNSVNYKNPLQVRLGRMAMQEADLSDWNRGFVLDSYWI